MESICGADYNNCGYGKNNNCKGCKAFEGCTCDSGKKYKNCCGRSQ